MSLDPPPPPPLVCIDICTHLDPLKPPPFDVYVIDGRPPSRCSTTNQCCVTSTQNNYWCACTSCMPYDLFIVLTLGVRLFPMQRGCSMLFGDCKGQWVQIPKIHLPFPREHIDLGEEIIIEKGNTAARRWASQGRVYCSWYILSYIKKNIAYSVNWH